jgi:hypothetical protein
MRFLQNPFKKHKKMPNKIKKCPFGDKKMIKTAKNRRFLRFLTFFTHRIGDKTPFLRKKYLQIHTTTKRNTKQ